MADKFSLPHLRPAPNSPKSDLQVQNTPPQPKSVFPLQNSPPSPSHSIPVISVIKHIVNTPPPPLRTAKYRPKSNEIQRKNKKNLLLESTSRPPTVFRNTQDEKGLFHSQSASNADLCYDKGSAQHGIQEGASSERGVQGFRNGTLGRQPGIKELSETGELLLHSILEQDGNLDKILESVPIEEGYLLAILKGLARFRQWKKALNVFDWMRNHEDHKPNAQAIAVMIRTLVGHGQCSKATDLFHNLRRKGYSMDVYSYTSLISNYSRNGKYREAISLFKIMEEDGCQPDIVAYNVMLDVYGKMGNSWKKSCIPF